MRVGAETNPAKVAGYIRALFEEKGDDFTVILQAVGPSACAQALKAVARVQTRLAEDPAADRCLVFQTQSRIQPREQQQGQAQQREGQAGQEDGSTFRTNKLILRLSSRSSWPDVAFNPATPEDTRKAAESQGRSKSSSQSSDSSTDAAAANCIPMGVRTSSAEEWQRLQKHTLIAAKRQQPAQFAVSGGKDQLGSRVMLLLQAVAVARKQALASEDPYDLQCTIASSSYTVERRKYETTGGTAADADADAETGAAAGADAGAPSIRNRYVVTVQRCEPSKKALAAAKGRAEAAARSKGGRGAGRSSGPKQTRPGFVEVREEEWNQLKEQLQVVPHLTEQLQIMTRQHEQLLTLLAAQQGQQQQE